MIPERPRAPTGKKRLRKPGGGRKPKRARVVFEAIMYVLRTGCQWKALPAERFGSASAIHKRFLEWEVAGVFLKLWQAGLAEYDEMEGIAWRWQSVDGALMKAPLALQSVGPIQRTGGENGSKRMLLVDARGVPLSLPVTAANRHDVTPLASALDALVVPRPKNEPPENLCADAGFAGRPAAHAIRERGYIPHVRPCAEERRRRIRGHKARRWVVEVAHSWFNRFRKLLVRYEKLHRSFVALNMLAAANICFRKVPAKVSIIYG